MSWGFGVVFLFSLRAKGVFVTFSLLMRRRSLSCSNWFRADIRRFKMKLYSWHIWLYQQSLTDFTWNLFSSKIHRIDNLLDHHHRSCHFKIDVFSRFVDSPICRLSKPGKTKLALTADQQLIILKKKILNASKVWLLKPGKTNLALTSDLQQ